MIEYVPKLHRNMSGVYALTGCFYAEEYKPLYIGSAVNLGRRINGHFRELKSGTHKNKFLQNVFSKHPTEWVVNILEFCNSGNTRQREQVYLDQYQPFVKGNGLNIARDAMAASLGLRFKRTGQALKNIISGNKKKAANPAWRARVAKINKEKPLDPAFIEKLKIAAQKRSQEHNDKCAEASRKRCKDPEFRKRHRESIVQHFKNNPERVNEMKATLMEACKDPMNRAKNSEFHARPYPAFINTITGEEISGGFHLLKTCNENGYPYKKLLAIKQGRTTETKCGWRLK